MLEFVEDYFGLKPDPRSAVYPFVSSSKQVIGIVALYIVFVKKIGPNFMKNRKPFDLKGALIIYNIIQIGCNAYLVYKGLRIFLFHRESFGRCLRVNINNTEAFVQSINLTYAYAILKYVDFVDTIFIVLRKRDSQATFLHFFHHISVSLVSTVVFRYLPFGHINLTGALNSFVHIVMYFYYLLCCIQSDMKKSIRWKKCITSLQMVQFVLMFVYLIYPSMNGENCGYPLKLLEIIAFESLIIFALFTNFYIKTYIKKDKSKVK